MDASERPATGPGSTTGRRTGREAAPARPRRRLRHRVPLPVRHHWRPVAVPVAGLTALVLLFGEVRVSPFVTSAAAGEQVQIIEDIRGSVDLYDTSVAHSIGLTYDEDDYRKMMDTFAETGEKEYIEADLVVDGTSIRDVGIRLKGNSTLMGLRSRTAGVPGGGRAPGARPGAQPGAAQDQAPGGAPGAARGQAQGPGGAAAPGTANDGTADGGTANGNAAAPAGGAPGGPSAVSLSRDEPQELPWLVKIDEYVEGRAYQGHQEISIRPGSDAALPLNEAVSLSVVGASGQAAQRYAFTTLRTNGGTAAGRLLVENPGRDWARERVGTRGVLYKALSTGSFTYRGEDPTAYEGDFDQLTRKGDQDLQPVIDLLRWVERSSDEEFAKGLADHVDVASFARYVATQNLLLNFDDMAGPGRNYYLWYDLGTKRFSVLGWDYNLTFSGDAATGPDDTLRMGPGGRGGNDGTAARAPAAGQGTVPAPGAGPAAGTPGAEEGARPRPGAAPGLPPQAGDAGPPGGAAGGMGAGNRLKERFAGLSAFDEVYEKAYRELYASIYASGTALTALERVGAQAAAVTADRDGVEAAAERLRTTVTDRTRSLAADPVVAGGA